MTSLKEFPFATGRMLFATRFREDQEEDYTNTLHTSKNIHIHTYIHTSLTYRTIQGVTGGTDQTSGGCSLC